MRDWVVDGGPRGLARRSVETARDLPPAAWLFVVLAIAVLVQWCYLEIGALTGNPSLFARFVLFEVGVALLVLIPAAILYLEDELTFPRSVLVGAILWAVPTAFVSLFRPLTSADTSSSFAAAFALIEEIAAIAGYVGPILIAIALSTRRRTATTYPLAVTFVLAAICAASFMETLSSVNSTTEALRAGAGAFVFGGDHTATVIQLYLTLLRPLQLIALFVLGWVALSAVRANEVDLRFWRPLAAGTWLLIAVTAYGMIASALVWWTASTEISTVLTGEPAQWLIAIADVAGSALVLAAFARALPNESPNGEPDAP